MTQTIRPAARARFDNRVLRPPAAAADEATRLQRQPACAAALRAWCRGAGAALAVAVLRSDDGPPGCNTLDGTAGGAAADLAAWADALARQLDGSTRLDGLGRAAGLAWRLRTVLGDAWPAWRRPDDPWDAGWARADAPALAHWQAGWWPRRPTLVLARSADSAALAPALAALAERLGPGSGPLRWLWVGGDGPAPAGLASRRFAWAGVPETPRRNPQCAA